MKHLFVKCYIVSLEEQNLSANIKQIFLSLIRLQPKSKYKYKATTTFTSIFGKNKSQHQTVIPEI